MKRYKNISIALLVSTVVAIGSCEKQTFEEPYTSLSPADAFSTPERIEKTATGMYDALQNPEYLGGRALIYADIRGIDCGVPTFFGVMPQFNTLKSTDGTVRLAWQAAYRTINESNLFIKNIDQIQGVISPELVEKYKGEGKFIRTLAYFYLVNLWAQPYKFTADASHLGVPIVLEASDSPFSPDNEVSRSTVAQVYSQMEKDLLEAVAVLPDAPAVKNFSSVARATKGAAYGLLSRIYLYKGDYANAVTYANKVIDANVYGLNASPATAFVDFTTNENIFSVAHNGGDNPNTNHALGQHYSPTKRADIQAAPEYVALMSPTDLRRSELIVSADGATWTKKYSTVADWVPVLRYSEILLIKAEALANLASGTTVDAVALGLVNDVRKRSAPNESITAATKAELIAAILLERRIELAFEGQGEFEFLRTGRDIPAHSTVALQPWGSSYVILPIPYDDLQKNPNLEPNKDY